MINSNCTITICYYTVIMISYYNAAKYLLDLGISFAKKRVTVSLYFHYCLDIRNCYTMDLFCYTIQFPFQLSIDRIIYIGILLDTSLLLYYTLLANILFTIL